MPLQSAAEACRAVEPERVTVHPKSSIAFTLLGVSELEGEILETLTCANTSGAPHEQGEVMTVHATASVTVPLLAFSRTEMGFEYSHDPEVDGDMLPREETRPLTFRNASRTPVTFALRCDPPFSVDKDVWSLEHDEAGTALVRFDPEYRGDRDHGAFLSRLRDHVADERDRDANRGAAVLGQGLAAALAPHFDVEAATASKPEGMIEALKAEARRDTGGWKPVDFPPP